MTQTTYTDNVKIDGSQDITQLDVEGHSTQNEALQQWSENGGDPLARVTGDGRLQVGSFDSGAMATDDSLIEAHRDEADTSKPTRGLHLLGEITGTLSSVISWVVQELVLKGTGGISALHSALRVKLTNENTGTMDAGAELRAGDFEVVNDGGSSGDGVTLVTGVRTAVTNNSGAYIDTAVGLDVELADAGMMTDAYGIRVGDVDQGSVDNFALKTGKGIVRLGDDLEIPLVSTAPTDNPASDFLKVYAEVDDKYQPQLYGRDSSGDVFNLSGDYRLIVPWTALSGGSVSVTDIPQDGETLHIQALLRTDRASNAWDYVDIRPNGNATASKYLGYYMVAWNGATNPVNGENYGGSAQTTVGPIANWFPAPSAPTDAFMLVNLSIADYASTTKHKFATYQATSYNTLSSVNRPIHMSGGAIWLDTAAIASLSFVTPTASVNFATGSQYALWRS